MGWEIGVIVVIGALGIVLLVKAGRWFQERRSFNGGFGVIIGIIFIMVAILGAVRISELDSRGKPAELEKDGIYEIRIVDFSEKDWVGVLVLKEEGKTDLIPPPYKKVSKSLFKKDDLVNLKLGEIRTIHKRTVDPPPYQEIIVKQ